MRRVERRGEYDRYEQRGNQDVRNREYDLQGDPGFDRDPARPSPYRGGEHQQGYQRPLRQDQGGNDDRRFGGSRSYRDPYTSQNYEPDYGYRPEPHFERQYRESYRGPERHYESDRQQNWNGERGHWEDRETGGRPREYQDDPREQIWRRERAGYEDRGQEPSYRGEDQYNRREPMREQERRGSENYYGRQQYRSRDEGDYREDESRYGHYDEQREREGTRGGYGPQPQYGYDSSAGPEYRPEEQFDSRARRGESGRGQIRGRDERGEYQEWLEEHQGRDRGTEGDRQLEGLREEHRHHHSDERYEEMEPNQPRSRRRFEEGEGREGYSEPKARPTQVRQPANRSQNRSRPNAARSHRSK